MKILKSLCATASLIGFLAAPAYSAATQGTIVALNIWALDFPDRVHINMTGGTNSGTAASCYGTQQNIYLLDTSTASGKQIFTMLLAAKQAGSTVKITGSGFCTDISNIENVSSATLK